MPAYRWIACFSLGEKVLLLLKLKDTAPAAQQSARTQHHKQQRSKPEILRRNLTALAQNIPAIDSQGSLEFSPAPAWPPQVRMMQQILGRDAPHLALSLPIGPRSQTT